MTNREQLAFCLSCGDYGNSDVAEIISDCLMAITDEDDCSIAVIFGDNRRRLEEWLGGESDA